MAFHTYSASVRTLTLVFAFTLSMGSTGCAGLVAESAHIEAETKEYVFDEDSTAVLATARRLLFTEGYSVTDSGPNALETDWKLSNEGKSRSRKLIQLVESEAGSRLSVMESRQGLDSDGDWYGGDPAYDSEFALMVIEELDTAEGNRIRTGAREAKDAARK